MWDVFKRGPRGRISLRNLILLATGLIVAVLVNIGITNRAFAADVTRSADGFTYQGKEFNEKVVLEQGDPLLSKLTTIPNSMVGAVTFRYKDPDSNRIEMLIFAPGINLSTSETVAYTTFEFTPPDTYANQQPRPLQTLTVGSPEQINTGQTSSCGMDNVGWFVCPISHSLAGFVDVVFGFISGFLEVKPSSINNAATSELWGLVRSIANICFVILFLIVIFSQITSLGISAYGLKKLLPRLVIAAVLVNASFYICALAIDLSNFIGYSLNNMFMGVYNSLKDTLPDNLNWGALTADVLAGGVAGGLLAGWGIGTIGAAAIGAFGWYILGSVVSVLFSAVVALLILAARQAIIVVMTIVSPLAFVLMVIPGTQKWFEKWRDSLLTLLIMFPIFSVLFGGAQLAGWAVILGGVASKDLVIIIMGMTVQLIPLVFTPFLVRLSSGILGTVARMVNDKNKGPIDRFRNFTRDMAGYQMKKSLASGKALPFSSQRLLQRLDSSNRRRELDKKTFEAQAENRAKSTARYRKSYKQFQDAEVDGKAIDSDLQAYYTNLQRTDPETFMREVNRRQKEAEAKREAAELEAVHSIITTKGAESEHLQAIMSQVKDVEIRNATINQANQIKLDTEETSFQDMTRRLAEAEVKANVAKRLSTDADLRQRVGGVVSENGTELVHAMAIAENRQQLGEFINARKEIFKHFRVDAEQVIELAKGENVNVERDGVSHTLLGSDPYTREVALTEVMRVGSYKQILGVIEATGKDQLNSNYAHSSAIVEAFISNGKNKTAPFINDKAYNYILTGAWEGPEFTNMQVVRRISEGRLTGDDLTYANAEALDMMFDSGEAINDPSHPEHARWTKALNDLLATEKDAVKRAQLRDNYHTYYRQMRRTVVETLRNPDFRRSTSAQSVQSMRRFLKIDDSESIDLIDWDKDLRFK